MTFSVKGEDALDKLTRLPSEMDIGVSQAAELAGQALVRQAQAGITSPPKSGRVYGAHQASAPGEYSANKSGDLLNSVDYEVSGKEYISFHATSGHAGYQEDGTSKMAARPNLGNALRDADAEVTSLIGQIIFQKISG